MGINKRERRLKRPLPAAVDALCRNFAKSLYTALVRESPFHRQFAILRLEFNFGDYRFVPCDFLALLPLFFLLPLVCSFLLKILKSNVPTCLVQVSSQS